MMRKKDALMWKQCAYHVHHHLDAFLRFLCAGGGFAVPHSCHPKEALNATFLYTHRGTQSGITLRRKNGGRARMPHRGKKFFFCESVLLLSLERVEWVAPLFFCRGAVLAGKALSFAGRKEEEERSSNGLSLPPEIKWFLWECQCPLLLSSFSVLQYSTRPAEKAA